MNNLDHIKMEMEDKAGDMPKVIWAWMGLQDNGSWDAVQDDLNPPATRYVRLEPDDIVISRKELEGMILIEHECADRDSVDFQIAYNMAIDDILEKK